MEHIVQFAINFDDQTIKRRLEANAYDDICEKIKSDILKDAPHGKYTKLIDWDTLLECAVDSFVLDYKDEIIDAAAEKLKESYFRTKAYKEKMKDVLNGSDN